MLLEERNVLEEKLLLKIFGSGGDDDALAGENGGHEIGEGFAGARAGLDDQVLLFGEGAFDCFGHLKLAVAIFEIGMPLGEKTGLRKELADRQGLRGWGGHLCDDFNVWGGGAACRQPAGVTQEPFVSLRYRALRYMTSAKTSSG